MFYMPRVVWRILNKKSGIAVTTITGEPLGGRRGRGGRGGRKGRGGRRVENGCHYCYVVKP